MDAAKFFTREAARRIRGQKGWKQRLEKVLSWLEANREVGEAFKSRYMSLKPAMRRNFWLLLRRTDADEALNCALRLQRILSLANTRRGFEFITGNGLRCVLKRLDKSEYAPIVIEHEQREMGPAWRWRVTNRFRTSYYSRHFIFIFEFNGTKFGAIYEFALSRGGVSVKAIPIIDSVMAGSPRYPTIFHRYFFYEDKIYEPGSRVASIIAEGIKCGLPPQIASLTVDEDRCSPWAQGGCFWR